MTIDLLVHPVRWLGDTRYRIRMLEIPKPPNDWRVVCRDPDGGVQVLAAISFCGGIIRTQRLPLGKVKR